MYGRFLEVPLPYDATRQDCERGISEAQVVEHHADDIGDYSYCVLGDSEYFASDGSLDCI